MRWWICGVLLGVACVGESIITPGPDAGSGGGLAASGGGTSANGGGTAGGTPSDGGMTGGGGGGGAVDAGDDGSDLVTYGAQHTVMSSWGCAEIWTPTNVTTPITVAGTSYPLTVIGAPCPPDSILLEPLTQTSGLHVTTNVAVWSLRFKLPPARTGNLQLSFYVYGGDTAAQAGGRSSIARWPGEFHDDGRHNSATYCDFGEQNSVYVAVVDQVDTSKSLCQLKNDSYYYLNIVVPSLDVRGNSSVFGWTVAY